MKRLLRMIKLLNPQCITGVCFQWRGSASYDSEMINETFVLSGNLRGEIATESNR